MDMSELTTMDPMQEQINSLQTQLGNAQDDLLKRNQQITDIYRAVTDAVVEADYLEDEQKKELLAEAGIPESFYEDAFMRSYEVEVTFTATVTITKTLNVDAVIGADEDQIIDALENDGIDVDSEMQDSSIWDFDWTDQDWEIQSFDEQ